MARLPSKKQIEGRASQWPWNRTNIFLPWAHSPAGKLCLTHQQWMCWGRLTTGPQGCRDWFSEGGQRATESDKTWNTRLGGPGWAEGWLPPEIGTRTEHFVLHVRGPEYKLNSVHWKSTGPGSQEACPLILSSRSPGYVLKQNISYFWLCFHIWKMGLSVPTQHTFWDGCNDQCARWT